MIENHMVLDLPNAPWNQEDETEREPEYGVCKYCGTVEPVDEMNTMIIDGNEEHCCIDCLSSENE